LYICTDVDESYQRFYDRLLPIIIILWIQFLLNDELEFCSVR